MITSIDGLTILYELKNEGVNLLRLFGQYGKITIPDMLTLEDGQIIPITELGDYCFASRAHLSKQAQDELRECNLGDGSAIEMNSMLRPLSGDYLEEIILPKHLVKIGDFAFYGCKNLRQITVSSKLEAIGSDTFMNCKSLHGMTICAGVKEKALLQKILAQINGEIEVSFYGENGLEAKLLYPQFTESYELLGPAHIFSLNLDGEGYRARKQFNDDVVDLAGYDAIFAKASHEEKFETLMKMAIDRLLFPETLGEDAKVAYEKYVQCNEERLMMELVKTEDTDSLKEILRTGIISPVGKKAAIEAAVKMGKTLLVSQIITM